MSLSTRRQLIALGVAVVCFALLAFLTYIFIPMAQISGGATPASPVSQLPGWQLGLANAGIILVIYGLAGLAAVWFALKMDRPAMFREGAGWRAWFTLPLLVGLGVGLVLIVGDQLFALAGQGVKGAHPSFPLSILASAGAAIGEEILFRGFVMGLWALLFYLILKRWNGKTAALWIGNVIAALACSATHLPSFMFLQGVSSPAQLPTLLIAEIFILNSILGLAAGERAIRDGLVAAIGVHFWADILWHVVWPLLAFSF